MIIAPLSIALARRQMRADAARLVILFLGSLLVAGAVSLVFAASQLRTEASTREDTRRPIPTAERKGSDLLLRGWIERIAGEEVEIVAASPADLQARQPILLPGLALGLPPGGIALSPELVSLVRRSDVASGRFAGWDGAQISPESLRDEGELLAYVRPALDASGNSVVLRDRAVQVRGNGFGGESWVTLYGVESAISGGAVPFLTFVLVGIPSLFVLIAASTARSDLLAQYVATLRRIGAPRRFVFLVLAAETAVPSVVGASVGLIIVNGLFSESFLVPFAGYRVAGGDGVISASTCLFVFFSTVVSTVLVTAMVSIAESRQSYRPHAQTWFSRIARWFATASPAGLVAGMVIGGDLGGSVFAISLLLLLLSLPVGIRVAARVLGGRMSRLDSSTMHLSGCRISAVSQRPARLLVGLTAILIISSTVQVFFTRFDKPASAPAPEFEAQLITDLTDTGFNAQSLVTSIDELTAIAAQRPDGSWSVWCSVPCEGDSVSLAQKFPGVGELVAAQQIMGSFGLPPERTTEVVVVTRRTSSSQVLGAIVGVNPAVQVSNSDLSKVFPSPVIPWINLGLSVATLLCLAAICLGYAAAVRATAPEYGALVRLGVAKDQLRQLALAESIVPLLACVAGSAVVSFVVAVLYAYLDRLGLPSFGYQIATTSAATILGVVLGLISAAAIPARAQRLALEPVE